ncbi:hypothetical protein [Pseudocitrobacter faecalis]|uniref:hypothetical protein n=1 Tax=Pseudocitrobacter faecalis TaxID=1398493 RepID=UPI003BA276C4
MNVSVVDLTTRPVDLIYKSLTPSVAPYMIEPEIVEKKCSFCERPVSEFGRQGYTFKNSYSQHVVHFVQCYSFCVSAPDIMGIDAPSKLKSSQKFDLWRGVGA